MRGLGRFGRSLGAARALALLALVAMIALRVADPPAIETLRLRGLDLFQQIEPRDYVKMPVVIVDIDDESLKVEGQWPWARTKFARLVDSLAATGAAAVAFDVLFSEEDRLSPALVAQDNALLPNAVRAQLAALPDNDDAFAEAMGRFRVVLARSGLSAVPAAEAALAEAPETPVATIGADPRSFLRTYGGLLTNLARLDRAASGHGMISIQPDVDGIIRRAPTAVAVGETLYPSLSVELLRVATGKDAYAIKTDEAGISSVVVGGVEVPTDARGAVWPHFTPHEPSRFVSATKVLDGTAPPEAFAGHLVLVGTSAVGLGDLKATPLDTVVPGVEIHAQVVEAVLGKFYLTRPNYALGAEIVAAAVLSLLVIWLVPIFGALRAFLLGAGVAAVVIGSAAYLYMEQGLLLDVLFPLATAFLLFAMLVAVNYLREERQRQQIRTAFGQYLAPALVEQLADEPGRLALGGETRQITILFTDVRGFTSISESMKDDPQKLTELINRLLTPLSDAIIERHGTIDKYMGDAIMAFWNAPLDDPDHARHACAAAVRMVDEVALLNTAFQAEAVAAGRTPVEIAIGIGINTGACVVGNMGTRMRFDYTALGDAVNLASRLEGQSKTYGLATIVGEGTANLVGEGMAMLEVDLIRVKGKRQPERIFAMVGGPELAASEDFGILRAMNRSMVASYRSQHWDAALEAAHLCRETAGRLGLDLEELLFLVETRIEEFRANPPGPHWDGVYTATEK